MYVDRIPIGESRHAEFVCLPGRFERETVYESNISYLLSVVGPLALFFVESVSVAQLSGRFALRLKKWPHGLVAEAG